METKKLHLSVLTALVAVFVAQKNFAQVSDEETDPNIAPPEYNVQDRLGVNIMSGSPQISQTLLSIGGKMGLQHSASNFTGNFAEWGARSKGFKHNYKGFAHLKDFQPLDRPVSETVDWLYTVPSMSIYGAGFNANFTYEMDLSNDTVTYTSIRDPRESLEFIVGTGLVYISSDGTEVTFGSDASSAIYHPSTGGTPRPRENLVMTKIKYPNGFTITSEGANNDRMWTNTGFQLNIFFEEDGRSLPPEKTGTTWMTEEVNGTLITLISDDAELPRSAIALNNAVETCSTRTECDELIHDWPRATYDWPAGAPLAMYIGESEFNITDANGQTTTYHHTAFEKAEQWDGEWVKFIEPETRSQPRVTEINYPNGDTVTYEYENKVFSASSAAYAALKRARRGQDTMGYSFNNTVLEGGHPPAAAIYGKTVSLSSGTYRPITVKSTNQSVGPEKITLWDKIVNLEVSTLQNGNTYHPNSVLSVEHLQGGGITEYRYDTRKNITAKIFKESDSASNTITMTAKYPDTCTALTRKTCNKPEWTEDGNGNRTEYEYHAESGQIAKVTYPANEHGIRRVKRYEYAEIIPMHNGPDTSPIWLLTKEKTCRNSTTYANGSCAGNDETVITYEYETDNLFKIGQVVTVGSKSLRTCFRYDIYGNEIEVTEPKANLASCAY